MPTGFSMVVFCFLHVGVNVVPLNQFFFVFSIHNPGYFVVDKDSTPERLVFNRTVTLRDSYGKSGK